MRSRYPHSFAAFAVLFATLATSGLAQGPAAVSTTTERIQALTYPFEATGETMEYELYVPTTYDAATPAPLIVLLHGLGSSPGRVIRYEGVTDFAEERGYIVVAPMGYNRRGWYGSLGSGSIPSFRRGGDRDDTADGPDNLGELSELDVMNVLELTLDAYNVDADRVYLAGHSMGGGGTWHIAMKYPDIWAALGPVAPAVFGPPDGLSAITHIPVIVIQGDQDALVPVDGTRTWVAKMAELGMTHRYIEIPGGDHTRIIARDPDNVEAIFDFFDQARRN